MNINKLTEKEKNLLSLINKNRKKKIKWDKMPKQEVYTHLYGWDNPHIDISLLLTPKEELILKSKGYSISNELKSNVDLLNDVRNIRKKGFKDERTFSDWIKYAKKNNIK